MRGVGGVEAAQSLPEAVVSFFSIVTHLGDPGFLIVAVALFYWLNDRREGAFLVALGICALGLTVTLKNLFGLPRPPAELRAVAETGYGFPSGHALGSTVVWGGLAYFYDAGSRRSRYLAAGVLVLLVSGSRVVIGVHYLVDVVAGFLLGASLLVAGIRATHRGPRPFFLIGVLLAFASVVVAGGTKESLVTLGTAVGSASTWEATRFFDAPGTARVVTATVGTVVVVAVLIAVKGLEEGDRVGVLALSTLVSGFTLLLPYAEAVRERKEVLNT
ncbi:MAG: phosphatase PAP2 family protein [Halobacteria archaeon]|nr:phosphatase PAP2 family protein [Halobacteria archaeon]